MLSVFTQSIGSFLLYCIIQVPVFFVGMVISSKQEWAVWDSRCIVKTYVSGQMIIWAVMQVLAVPLIQLRAQFNVLFYCFMGIITFLAVFGCWRFLHIEKKSCISTKNRITSLSPVSVIIFVILIALVMLPFVSYFLGQHVDSDDARWLAEANDALEYGDMMTRDYSTGEYMGHFVIAKDIASPWPMFFAALAKLLHVNAAVSAHTLYAPIAILISYGIYYLIAYELFEKTESRFTFLFSVALINLFYAGTIYTQSVFSLVRIWQGKATVAAVIIPLLLYLAICINKRDDRIDWVRMGITCCAACLLSGMGIFMSGIMIAVFGAYSTLAYRRWKRIPVWLISIMPAIVFGIVYLYWKG